MYIFYIYFIYIARYILQLCKGDVNTCVKKMSNGGGITFNDVGYYYKVIESDAIIIHYLFKEKVINKMCYIQKYKIDFMIYILDKLNINYFINGNYFNYDDNNYDNYLLFANKYLELETLIYSYEVNYDR